MPTYAKFLIMYFQLFCRLKQKLKQKKRQTRQKAQKQKKRLRNQKKMVKTQMRTLQQIRQKAQVREMFILSWKEETRLVLFPELWDFVH